MNILQPGAEQNFGEFLSRLDGSKTSTVRIFYLDEDDCAGSRHPKSARWGRWSRPLGLNQAPPDLERSFRLYFRQKVSQTLTQTVSTRVQR
jgi:hypothetical protein